MQELSSCYEEADAGLRQSAAARHHLEKEGQSSLGSLPSKPVAATCAEHTHRLKRQNRPPRSTGTACTTKDHANLLSCIYRMPSSPKMLSSASPQAVGRRFWRGIEGFEPPLFLIASKALPGTRCTGVAGQKRSLGPAARPRSHPATTDRPRRHTV